MIMQKRTNIEIEFELNNVVYIARKYTPKDTGYTYWEIVEKLTDKRPKNIKDIVRQFGIEVSTDANIETTHSAVKKLIGFLEKRQNGVLVKNGGKINA